MAVWLKFVCLVYCMPMFATEAAHTWGRSGNLTEMGFFESEPAKVVHFPASDSLTINVVRTQAHLNVYRHCHRFSNFRIDLRPRTMVLSKTAGRLSTIFKSYPQGSTSKC